MVENRVKRMNQPIGHWQGVLMPDVHSRRVCFARFSSESYSRRGCASMTFYMLAVSFQFTQECGLKKKKQSKIRGDSQAKHETLWLGHHGSLKKWELTRRDTNARGYTRASETRRMFPSIFSLDFALSRVLSAKVYSWHNSWWKMAARD